MIAFLVLVSRSTGVFPIFPLIEEYEVQDTPGFDGEITQCAPEGKSEEICSRLKYIQYGSALASC